MKLEIFEPSLCCASGVCGPEPDKELIELQNTINTLTKAGVTVERFAINQAPMAFVNNPVVKQFLIEQGPGKLPITLLDGKIIRSEGYPAVQELKEHIPGLEEIKLNERIIGIFN